MDYRTLFVVLITSLLIQSVALWITWFQNRDQLGVRDWAWGGLLMVFSSLTASLGLFLEAHLALAVALKTIGTTAGILGWVMVWIGARHFHSRAAFRYQRLVPLAVVLLVVVALENQPYWRMTLVSAGIAIASMLALWEFCGRDRWHRPVTLFTLTLFFASVLVWTARALSHMGGDNSMTWIDTLSLYMAIVTSFGLTLSMIMLTNARINERLYTLASRDPLTGALNRRAFIERSDAVLATLRRQSGSVALAIIDLDHFKQVNDNHGHAAGDEVLRRFAALTQRTLRSGDVFGRYGGEEFAVLLTNSSAMEAQKVIERLRRLCHETGVRLENGDLLKVTFSAGLSHARGPVDLTLADLLKAADGCLYGAKEAGRDRISLMPAPLMS